MKITKFFFHIINLLFLIFYLYPGSILGFFIYNDFNKQPQVTSDFVFFSSNHVYAFLILSTLGLISYLDKKKFVISYFIFLSVILELFHLVIPNRSFQFYDLFGNILGVLIPIIILNIYFYLRKK